MFTKLYAVERLLKAAISVDRILAEGFWFRLAHSHNAGKAFGLGCYVWDTAQEFGTTDTRSHNRTNIDTTDCNKDISRKASLNNIIVEQ